MCGPALPLIAAAMAVAGTATSALSANAQARYQAKIADRNAAMEREAAQQDQANGVTARQEQYRRIAQLKGSQRARAAANGVGVDFGTAADVQADTDLLGREDISRIDQQTFQNVRGRDIQASNYEAQAGASRQAGTAALVSGAFSAGSSILGGVQQYNKLKPQ